MADDKLYSKFTSRKFFLAVGFGVFSSVALLLGALSGGNYVALVTIILGLYNASNSGIKYLQAKTEKHIEE